MPVPIRWICKYCGWQPTELHSPFGYDSDDCLYYVMKHEAQCVNNPDVLATLESGSAVDMVKKDE